MSFYRTFRATLRTPLKVLNKRDSTKKAFYLKRKRFIYKIWAKGYYFWTIIKQNKKGKKWDPWGITLWGHGRYIKKCYKLLEDKKKMRFFFILGPSD